MSIDWNRVIPVLVSIGIIVSVAVLRNYSKQLAAIAATMPINIPLGLWIIYAGEGTNTPQVQAFAQSIAINMIPTILFAFVAYFALKAGWTLIPTLALGYVVWGVSLGISYWLRG
jgi:hypothetical protein